MIRQYNTLKLAIISIIMAAISTSTITRNRAKNILLCLQ